jgi:phosphatidate cytidylyltransferase
MLLIYCFSHALFLFDMNFADVPAVGVVGWFLFVTLLSEVNDIMQAIVGRKFGRHKIAPQVSPHKTYEGLLGGISATVVASVLLAPLLTTIAVDRGMTGGFLWSAAAGILISLAGFAGDLQMSAIKRDAGVKDGSDLLPGMGGMIDRIDSLTFSAPVFYYFVMCLNS